MSKISSTPTDSPVDQLFDDRKRDHILISLSDEVQTTGLSGFDQVQLPHCAFPEINFADVNIQAETLGQTWASPFFVSSMTAGHHGSVDINRTLASACAQKGWFMGVGSQRKELFDAEAEKEWQTLKREVPRVNLLGNLGVTQLINTPLDAVKKLVDTLEAKALFVHTNPLQEVMQPEGTPQFAGGLNAIAQLVKGLNVPVIVKETGCGFSSQTLQRLIETGVYAVDLAGLGGTHWGRVEGGRNSHKIHLKKASQCFKNWGISTTQSLMSAYDLDLPYQVWASGGVRSGLDGAKCLAMGATMVGVAQPLLVAALKSEEALVQVMDQFEFELKVALFCTGCKDLNELRNVEVFYG